jgi:hypothetical protein
MLLLISLSFFIPSSLHDLGTYQRVMVMTFMGDPMAGIRDILTHLLYKV